MEKLDAAEKRRKEKEKENGRGFRKKFHQPAVAEHRRTANSRQVCKLLQLAQIRNVEPPSSHKRAGITRHPAAIPLRAVILFPLFPPHATLRRSQPS